MEYFEELQNDWDALGFSHEQLLNRYRPTRQVSPENVRDYEDLHHLMINLTLNIAAVHDPWSKNRLKITEDDMATDLGRRLVFLCQLPEFTKTVDRHMCPDSEPNIALSFDPENIARNDFPSPVIVTRENVAIGAIKRIGERSYYALRNDSATQTQAGQVYRTPLSDWARPFADIAKSPHAARIDVSSIDKLINATRFTFFSIPSDARTDIKVPHYRKNYHHSLGTSHEELVTSIDNALENAVPTNLGDRFKPGPVE